MAAYAGPGAVRRTEHGGGEDTAVLLRCGGRPVVRYTYRPGLQLRFSPRPFLHPVTTLGGVPVSDCMPADHRHHLGVGVVVPDLAGRDFWGGPAGTAGSGVHGVQAHTGWLLRDPDGFVEELSWIADGHQLLRERRTVAVRLIAARCWALDFTFALTNATGGELHVGAGYGGFFWRAPADLSVPPQAFTASGEGEAAVDGRPARWVALRGARWTLVFAGATAATRRDPWFVRTGAYPGVGSSLAVREPLPIGPGETVTRRVVTAVADGRLGRGECASLAARLAEA